MSNSPFLPQDALPVPLAIPTAHRENDPFAPDIETASDGYALRFSGATGAFLLERQAAAVGSILDHVGAEPVRLLEVGGGHAQLTPLFLHRGHSVTVHGSAAACFPKVQVLQENFPDRVSCLLGSIRHLPVQDGEFDLVCCIRLIGHVTRWQELLEELCRAARRFVICEFSVRGGLQRLAGALHGIKVGLEPDARPFTVIGVDEMSAELERHGFRLVRLERQFVLPISLHRKLKSPEFSRSVEGLLDRFGLTESLGSPAVLLAERIT